MISSNRKLGFLTLLVLVGLAAAGIGSGPAWWATSGAVDSNLQENDYSAVNVGNLKHFTAKAVAELNAANPPDGAGPTLNALVQSWTAAHPNEKDYDAVTVSQLKYIGALIYDRLGLPYPWTATTSDDQDGTVANIGQLKTVFNFEIVPSTNGIPNWWIDLYFPEGGIPTDPEEFETWLQSDPTDSGLTIAQKIEHGLDPHKQSTNDIGIPDGWLVQYGLDPLTADPESDDDEGIGDGLALLAEYEVGTDPNSQDTDGDNLLDGEEAVPTNEAMRVLAAPEVKYAIIDLGEDYSPRGVNDSGIVSLWKPGSGYFVWHQGSALHLVPPHGAQILIGPLQDGTVYYSGEGVDYNEGEPWVAVSSPRYYPRMVWTPSGGSEDGILVDDVYYSSESYPWIPPNQFPSSSALAALMSQTSAMAPELNSVDPDYSEALGHLYGQTAVRTNDAHTNIYDLHYYTSNNLDVWGDAEITGYSGSMGDVVIGAWSSVYGTDTSGFFVVGAHGTDADFIVNNQGFVAGTSYKYINNERTIEAVGTYQNGQWANITGCDKIWDLTESLHDEGPYILGQSGSATTLWCYNQGGPVSIPIEGSAWAFERVVGRSISNHLVIPMGSSIWRNSRVRSLTKLCGNPESWTNISARLVSPNNNLLAGTATKAADGKTHALNLIPVELYDDAINSSTVAWNGETLSLAQVQSIPTVITQAFIRDNGIAWIKAHTDSNNPAPEMPKLVARAPIPGAHSITYKWRLEVKYDRPNGGTQATDTVKIPKNSQYKDVPADEEWRIFEEQDWEDEINQNGFFGGTAKLFLWTPGSSEPTKPVYEFRIGGENPDDQRCKDYINEEALKSPYTANGRSMWYAYAIAKTESKDYNDGVKGQQNTRYNQFWEKSGSGSDRGTFKNGDPLWIRQPSEPGAGGYGMFQVTGSVAGINVNIPREQLWNWQKNVKAALEIIKNKRDEATYAVTDSQGNIIDGKSGAWDWMNDPQNRPGKSFPHGQRPQAKNWNNGVDVPVDVRVVEGVRFEDGTDKIIEDAVTIKMYNGASVMYCSWGGTAWSFNNTNSSGFDYVGRVCKEVEP